MNYIGSPPNCRPECVVHGDCSLDKSCLSQKCRDPCPGTCGINANCNVVNHSPICSCKSGYTGDPFIRCIFEESKPMIDFKFYPPLTLHMYRLLPQGFPLRKTFIIPAIPHHVDLIHCVEQLMNNQYAHVFKVTLGSLHTVNQNVF